MITEAIEGVETSGGLTEAQVQALIDAAIAEIDTDGGSTEQGGCGSTVAFGGTAAMLALAVAGIACAMALRKRNNN